jgi:hypothetical protein
MKPFSALAHILRSKKSVGDIVFAILIPFLLYECAHLLMLSLRIGDAAFLLNIIFAAFFIIYLPVLINTIYYDVSGLEREDLNKLNIWKMK